MEKERKKRQRWGRVRKKLRHGERMRMRESERSGREREKDKL